MRIVLGLLLIATLWVPSHLQAQQTKATPRDVQVRQDKKAFSVREDWVYNDWNSAKALAKSSGKPLLIVFRCIPCEACHDFDDSVARRDAKVRDLMDQFVCIRIVRGNDLDLNSFQYDSDQSFAMAFCNADGTLYGRFGTRSNRDDETVDITLDGLRESLELALKLHKEYPKNKEAFAGKQSRPLAFRTPMEFPNLRGKYTKEIDYEGATARSCIHCHQVGEAVRLHERQTTGTLSDKGLFPYPNPRVLGINMNPEKAATIANVKPNSPASDAGLRPGDQVSKIEGQPILSTADFQWILHHAPDQGTIAVEGQRNGKPFKADVALNSGWRKNDDISWRTTTWELRRIALGGMALEPATAEHLAKTKAEVQGKTKAFHIKHVGQYGEHKVAWDAGIRAGDILVSYDGKDFASESAIIAHAIQNHKAGDKVVIKWIRGGKTTETTIPIR